MLRLPEVRRIHRGVYTTNLKDPLEIVVLRNGMHIVAHIVPTGILSFKTALELKPTPYHQQNIVFLTSSYSKNLKIPGLIISVIKGNKEYYHENILPNLARSTPARMLLENLTSTRGDLIGIKTVGEKGVEQYLAKEMRHNKEKALNRLREEAKEIAEKLELSKEFKKLNAIISALQGTHPDSDVLQTPCAMAIVKKVPYDLYRYKLFEELSLYLQKCQFMQREYQFNSVSFRNLSFFESYFSNFIEGAEFIISEAEDIIFSGKEIKNRHADSHDILANYSMTNDFLEMSKTPSNITEFINLLQARHAYLMKERPDKNPGRFKEVQNKTGNTQFVDPQDVVGTLTQGFEFYQLLNNGMEKALFMQFLISEVHPFDDGNGRISRIMMNAELVSPNLIKIIVPTVCRENYLNGLRRASRDGFFQTYCKVMDQVQAYTKSINWLDYGAALEKIEVDQAEKTPDEALPIFNRALRGLLVAEFPV